MDSVVLSIVVPCYNEEGNVSVLVEKINEVIEKDLSYEIIFVDDGSRDNTRKEIKRLASLHSNVFYISFAFNGGHQVALMAGLRAAKGDAVVCLDADMQHPPELINQMLKEWRNGEKIVQAKRLSDPSLPLSKRLLSDLYYKLLSRISGTKLLPGTSDFRLIDREVNDYLKAINEQGLFFRGLIPSLHIPIKYIEYQPQKRLLGESKYTLKKMLRLGLDGVISSGVNPLRLATIFSIVFASLFMVQILYVLIISLLGFSVPGWASISITISGLAVANFVVLSAISEYLGFIAVQIKNRPLYFVSESDVVKPGAY